MGDSFYAHVKVKSHWWRTIDKTVLCSVTILYLIGAMYGYFDYGQLAFSHQLVHNMLVGCYWFMQGLTAIFKYSVAVILFVSIILQIWVGHWN